MSSKFKLGDKVKVLGVMPNGLGSTMYTNDSKLDEYSVSTEGVYTITEVDGINGSYPYKINGTKYAWCSEELALVSKKSKNVVGGELI